MVKSGTAYGRVCMDSECLRSCVPRKHELFTRPRPGKVHITTRAVYVCVQYREDTPLELCSSQPAQRATRSLNVRYIHQRRLRSCLKMFVAVVHTDSPADPILLALQPLSSEIQLTSTGSQGNTRPSSHTGVDTMCSTLIVLVFSYTGSLYVRDTSRQAPVHHRIHPHSNQNRRAATHGIGGVFLTLRSSLPLPPCPKPDKASPPRHGQHARERKPVGRRRHQPAHAVFAVCPLGRFGSWGRRGRRRRGGDFTQEEPHGRQRFRLLG